MTHVLAPAMLLLVTVGWFLLALLPALREHFGRSDVDPLRVSSGAADIRYFANSFQQFVDTQLTALRAASAVSHPAITTLSDGEPVWYAPSNGAAATTLAVFDGGAPIGSTQDAVVISEVGLRVPNDGVISRELYTSGALEGGERSVFRAALAKGDAQLAAESVVMRWVDAGGTLRIGRDSTLWGRASSWGTMSLAEGTRFQRLAAPRIEFGSPVDTVAPDARGRHIMAPPDRVKIFARRWTVSGDLEIPSGGMVDNDIIITGTLTVGRGARLGGAVRSAVVVADDDCVFSGAIVATERLALGANCRVTGPVVVEGEAVFGEGCRVGEPDDETTIAAVQVRVACGVVLCGEIWARQQGVVSAACVAPARSATSSVRA